MATLRRGMNWMVDQRGLKYIIYIILSQYEVNIKPIYFKKYLAFNVNTSG